MSNKNLKIVFFGLGSIGQRHLQNISKLFSNLELYSFKKNTNNFLIKDGKKNNKIDILIEYDYNLEPSTQALPKMVLIESSPLFLVFHNTEKGRFLKYYFDKNIAELARNGVLRELFPDLSSFNRAHIRP